MITIPDSSLSQSQRLLTLTIPRFIGDIQLHPDHIEKQCKAASGLCNWLHLVYSYQQLCYLLNVQTSINYK